jgi:hypothetical protein
MERSRGQQLAVNVEQRSTCSMIVGIANGHAVNETARQAAAPRDSGDVDYLVARASPVSLDAFSVLCSCRRLITDD